MWAKLLEFVASPIGALLGKVMMGLTLAGMIWIAINNYNEGIRTAERDRNEKAQLEQVVKDSQALGVKLDKLNEQNQLILQVTAKKNQVVADKHTKVNEFINSPVAQKSNRAASDVLKGTIGMLRNED